VDCAQCVQLHVANVSRNFADVNFVAAFKEFVEIALDAFAIVLKEFAHAAS